MGKFVLTVLPVTILQIAGNLYFFSAWLTILEYINAGNRNLYLNCRNFGNCWKTSNSPYSAETSRILPNKCTCLNKCKPGFWFWLAISQKLLSWYESSFQPSKLTHRGVRPANFIERRFVFCLCTQRVYRRNTVKWWVRLFHRSIHSADNWQ